MMYAFSRNLLRRVAQVLPLREVTSRVVLPPSLARSLAPSLTLALALSLILVSVAPLWAASSSTAPHTGMEGGSRHTYGPDGEGRKDKRVPTGGSPVDAYGNPIILDEQVEEAPRQRPRPGAYGVRPTPPPSRPLPDLPAEPKGSGWKFK